MIGSKYWHTNGWNWSTTFSYITVWTFETEIRIVNLRHLIKIKEIQHNISLGGWMIAIIKQNEVGDFQIIIRTRRISDIQWCATGAGLLSISSQYSTASIVLGCVECQIWIEWKNWSPTPEIAEWLRYLPLFYPCCQGPFWSLATYSWFHFCGQLGDDLWVLRFHMAFNGKTSLDCFFGERRPQDKWKRYPCFWRHQV